MLPTAKRQMCQKTESLKKYHAASKCSRFGGYKVSCTNAKGTLIKSLWMAYWSDKVIPFKVSVTACLNRGRDTSAAYLD